VKPLFYEQRYPAAVIDMRVGQYQKVDSSRVKRERLMVLSVLLRGALKLAAIQKKSDRIGIITGFDEMA